MPGLHGGPGALLHLKTAWDTCLEAVEGLELLSIIDRGGSASVFKGGCGAGPAGLQGKALLHNAWLAGRVAGWARGEAARVSETGWDSENVMAQTPPGLAICGQYYAPLPMSRRARRAFVCRCFAGRWGGATVAVKVVEHGAEGKLLEQVQREAALATSVSHPNVVRKS